MTWATFWDPLEQLQPQLEGQHTDMWLPFPTDTRLVLILLKLAMPASLQYVSHLSGMGKATAREAVLEAGGTMLCVHNSLVVVVAGFCALGFLQCIGAPNGTHISATCPPHRDCPYYSCRSHDPGDRSMVIQAVLDPG
ncbi:hypothetical protein Y1Q_0009861 [Alligator mississippiensis]|uniref:Uncharacterized protein n=1 Tax=Alligator mississippiensis TaxID=8496 RepID=A0A151MX23_ALLMI|nr:hypothetical protein Y1Q_0009861 [Alligator mississippiensis]